MFDTLGGVPAHPLFVHAAVAFVPLFALVAILYALVPAWRAQARVPLVVTGVLAAAGSFIAVGAGEELENRLKRHNTPGVDWDLVHEHAEAGDLVRILVIAAVVIAIVAAYTVLAPAAARRGGKKNSPNRAVQAIAAALVVIGSVAACYQTYVAGHSGARSVWQDTVRD